MGRLVYINERNVFHLTVSGLKNCLIIKEHFIKFPLMTYKLVYFNIWCMVLNILINKEHLNLEGLL